MFLKRKGYSIIEWALLLGIVIGLLALTQDRLTRALETKGMLTAHQLLWREFDPNEPIDLSPGNDYDNTKSKTRTYDQTKMVQIEKHSGEKKSVVVPNPRDTYRQTETVSVSTAGEMGENVDSEVLDSAPNTISYATDAVFRDRIPGHAGP